MIARRRERWGSSVYVQKKSRCLISRGSRSESGGRGISSVLGLPLASVLRFDGLVTVDDADILSKFAFEQGAEMMNLINGDGSARWNFSLERTGKMS